MVGATSPSSSLGSPTIYTIPVPVPEMAQQVGQAPLRVGRKSSKREEEAEASGPWQEEAIKPEATGAERVAEVVETTAEAGEKWREEAATWQEEIAKPEDTEAEAKTEATEAEEVIETAVAEEVEKHAEQSQAAEAVEAGSVEQRPDTSWIGESLAGRVREAMERYDADFAAATTGPPADSAAPEAATAEENQWWSDGAGWTSAPWSSTVSAFAAAGDYAAAAGENPQDGADDEPWSEYDGQGGSTLIALFASGRGSSTHSESYWNDGDEDEGDFSGRDDEADEEEADEED